MKYSTICLIMLFAVTFIPIPNVTWGHNAPPEFDHSRNEGYVAYVANSQEKEDDNNAGPHPNPDKCACKGTGTIIHGDGHKTECPYHSKDEADSDDRFETKQILWFTASWCPPCQQFKETEVPKLKASGWIIEDSKKAHIRIVDIDEYPELYDQYGNGRNIPLFALFKKKKETDYRIGFHTGPQIANMYNEETNTASTDTDKDYQYNNDKTSNKNILSKLLWPFNSRTRSQSMNSPYG